MFLTKEVVSTEDVIVPDLDTEDHWVLLLMLVQREEVLLLMYGHHLQ